MLSPKFCSLRRRKLNSRIKKASHIRLILLVIEATNDCASQQFPAFIHTRLRTEKLTLFYNVHLLKQRIYNVILFDPFH